MFPSSSEAEERAKSYFNALHAIARAENSEIKPFSDAVKFKALHSDWNDRPYIFYEYEEDGYQKFASYVGRDKEKGIAEQYTRIPSASGFTLARLLINEYLMNEGIDKADIEDFDDDTIEMQSDIIKFPASTEERNR